MIEKAVDFAMFIPKNVIAGVSEKICDKEKRGKQSLKSLYGDGSKLENIPINADCIKVWKSVARKYKIDYSLKKSVTPQTGGDDKVQYVMFYKSRDINTLTAAFKEYSVKVAEKERKQSVQERVKADRNKNKERKTHDRERKREKKKERGVEIQ